VEIGGTFSICITGLKGWTPLYISNRFRDQSCFIISYQAESLQYCSGSNTDCKSSEPLKTLLMLCYVMLFYAMLFHVARGICAQCRRISLHC